MNYSFHNFHVNWSVRCSKKQRKYFQLELEGISRSYSIVSVAGFFFTELWGKIERRTLLTLFFKFPRHRLTIQEYVTISNFESTNVVAFNAMIQDMKIFNFLLM